MKYVLSVIRFSFLSAMKIFSHLFYTSEFKDVDGSGKIRWDEVKLAILLNHTSLFEPIYIRGMTWSFVWKISRHLVYPAADVTLQRPFVGVLFKLMAPKAVPISRKRDDTWSLFMEEARREESVVILLPEGRMKRADGFDKKGEPMTVKGGVADVLKCVDSGTFLVCYSGGLHHVHTPGDRFPKVFKHLKMYYEQLPIAEYKSQFSGSGKKLAIVRDLEKRRDLHSPRADQTPWRTEAHIES